MPVGTVRFAPGEEQAARSVGRCAVFSASGPTMKPGRVAQEQDRQVERVAQLHEAGGLVGAVGVDRAAEMGRVVGDHAERPAVRRAGERGDDAGAEAARSSSTSSSSVSIDSADVVDALAVRGDEVARAARVAVRAPRRLGVRPAEVRQVALGGRDRRRLVRDPEVDDAVGVLDVDRPDLARARTRRGRRPRSSPARPCRCSSLRSRSRRRSTRAARRCRRSSTRTRSRPAGPARSAVRTGGRRGSRARRRAAQSTSPGRPPPPSANRTTGRRRRSAISNSRSFFRWLRIPWVPARTV